ncbi:PQQ-binding-like beta-propeller repeat protein [Streptomyces sp. NPDC093546]|uniref:outer membrane protein assembly factor BamB family protein n=1 Tax=Streptomyces sp. NPDC093546 TaxID=3366040 RepID=UPI0037F401AE
MATGTSTSSPGSWWQTLLALLVVLAVGLAVFVGLPYVFLGSTGYMPFISMKQAWETPVDRAAGEYGNGAWVAGDTVVRSRYDAVTGFDAGSGKERWEYLPPRRAEICTVSSRADDSVALIVYSEKDKDCVNVAAIDLTDGRELWRTVTAQPAAVATGGGLAVVEEGTKAVRVFDLRSGAARWKAAVPKGCTPDTATAAKKQVLAVLTCGDELKLAAFDPADGAARWTVPLDERQGMPAGAYAGFASADPIVLRVMNGQEGSTLSFTADGRPQGRIERVGDYGTIKDVAVAGGRLFAVATYQGSQSTLDQIVAFDLASGDELWREDGGGGGTTPGAFHAEGDRVMYTVNSRKYGDRLMVFDAATGDEEEDREFREEPVEADDLLTYKDLVIAVRSGVGVRPFTAYERW